MRFCYNIGVHLPLGERVLCSPALAHLHAAHAKVDREGLRMGGVHPVMVRKRRERGGGIFALLARNLKCSPARHAEASGLRRPARPSRLAS